MDANGRVNTSRSQVFGDVDSGDSRRFESEGNRNVVWPRKGDSAGAPGPIALTIQLWESDQGDPDEIKKKTEQAFELGGNIPGHGEWIKRVPPIVRDQLAKLIADDLMGSKSLLFPASRLAHQLPRPGTSFVQRHHFSGQGGDLPFEVAGGPDYDLFLQVTRVA
jgi:hypothetical protein